MNFEQMLKINVNDKVEKKQNLTYLSWAWAWAEFKKIYTDARYSIRNWEGKPYLFDSDLGYYVETSITATTGEFEETHSMWLFVMDGANNAMLNQPYEYQVMAWDNNLKKKVPVTKKVEKATMFDVNKTLMRCLVKNMAMFGLGLYIYAGEDLPEDDTTPEEPENKSWVPNTVLPNSTVGMTPEQIAKALDSISKATNINQIFIIHDKAKKASPEVPIQIMDALTAKKQQLEPAVAK